MSSTFQSITFALLLLILRGFCTTVTHASSPPLQAPRLLSGLQQRFFVVLSSGSAQSVVLAQVRTSCLPAWGVHSPPFSGSFLESQPGPWATATHITTLSWTFVSLDHPPPSVMPPAASSSAVLPIVHPERGAGYGEPRMVCRNHWTVSQTSCFITSPHNW